MNTTAQPMRPGVGSAAFVAAMLGSSALTLLRMVVAAALLTTADFGIYATIVAAAALLSTVISFGAVESTIKAFPRLVAQGHREAMERTGRRITLIVLRRSAVLAAAVLALGGITGNFWILALGVAIVLAFGVSYAAILASMQRAVGQPAQLASGTALRAGGVFLAVVAAATSGDVSAVIAAEFVATLLTGVISHRLFFSSATEAGSPAGGETPSIAEAGDADGRRLFFAYTLIAAPFYLDRLFVGATFGLERAGQYAVLALLLTGATLLINTIAQRVGPDAIRLATSPDGGAAAGRLVAIWCGIASVLWLLGIASLALLLELGTVPESLARYELTTQLLLPIAASGVMLNTGLLEFLLIALDRERAFLRAAFLFVGLAIVTAALVAWQKPGLGAFLWGLAACRFVYAGALFNALRSRRAASTG